MPDPATSTPIIEGTRKVTGKGGQLVAGAGAPGLCVPMTFGLWISVLPLLVVAAACVRVLLVANPR